MNYKIYKTPDPHNRLDASLPCKKGIADLLLDFEDAEGFRKIVTVPAQNEAGFNVVACQSSLYRGKGGAAYVFIPEPESLYLFREALVPIRSAVKCFLKGGLKGLILGAEETGIIGQRIRPYDHDDRDYDHWSSLCIQRVSQDDWYHFTGKAEEIVTELYERCAINVP